MHTGDVGNHAVGPGLKSLIGEDATVGQKYKPVTTIQYRTA